jgi:hypothetical protein
MTRVRVAKEDLGFFVEYALSQKGVDVADVEAYRAGFGDRVKAIGRGLPIARPDTETQFDRYVILDKKSGKSWFVEEPRELYHGAANGQSVFVSGVGLVPFLGPLSQLLNGANAPGDGHQTPALRRKHVALALTNLALDVGMFFSGGATAIPRYALSSAVFGKDVYDAFHEQTGVKVVDIT